MGLIGSTIGRGIGMVKNAVVDGCQALGGCQNADKEDTSTGTIGDTIEETEDSINDDVQDTTEDVGDSVDQGTENVFDLTKDGFDAVEGFLNWLAGFGETMRGLGNWIQNNGDLIPLAGGAIELAGAFIGGLGNVIAGFFHGIAGSVAFFEGFVAFLSTLNGWEGAGFLLGLFLILISGFVVLSGVLSGRFLVVPTFVQNTFGALIGAWIGGGLILWSSSNLIGAMVIAGTGAILLFYATVAERGQLIIFGGPAALVGFFMVFAALKAGFVANVVFTAAAIFAIVYASEYLEKRVAPSVTKDKNLVLSRRGN